MANIVLFCASSDNLPDCYKNDALELGHWIGKNQHTLIFGGTNKGLMEIAAKATKQAGGHVIGILPQGMSQQGFVSPHSHETILVENLLQRKEVMLQQGDIFVVLAGGIGTMDELFEVLATGHLGYHNKKIVLCNTNDFYTPLVALFNNMYQQNIASTSYQSKMFTTNNMNHTIETIEKIIIPI